MKDALLAALLLADLFCGAYGLGRLLLGRVGRSVGIGERAVFAVPLGLGLIGYVVLALGLMGQFRPAVMVGVLALCPLGAVVLLRDLLAARKEDRRDDGGAASPGVAGACGLALAAIGFCSFVATLAPPSGLEWDALSYHLAAPKVFLREGRIFFIPYDHHSNFPFTLQMLYGVMLGVGSAPAAKLCHWLCGALLVWSVYAFGARHYRGPAGRGRTVGLIGAVLVASTPMAIWEATIAYVDLATTLYTWLSLHALFNAARSTGIGGIARDGDEESEPGLSVPWLVVSAVLMGFALGTKYTVLAYWGFLLIGILGWHFITTRRWAKETIPHAAIWGAVSLAVAAPWYVKNVLYTGNPVYPFAYGLFGGRYWSAENARLYTEAQNALGLPKTPANFLLDPWQATMVTLPDPRAFTEYFTFALSPAFVGLTIGALLLGRRLSRNSLFLLLFGAGAYLAWFFTVQQTRYLLPGLPALALVGGEVLLLLWATAKASRYVAATLATLSALWGIYIAGGLAFWGVEDFAGSAAASPAWPVVSGAMGDEEFLRRRALGYGPAMRWINENAPKDAKVALFDEVRGYYLDREYAWATPNHAAGLFPWDTYADADAWLADFKRRGYTHLLVGAVPPAATNDGQRWRELLTEAVSRDTVELAHEVPAGQAAYVPPGATEPTRVPLSVKVYRIR